MPTKIKKVQKIEQIKNYIDKIKSDTVLLCVDQSVYSNYLSKITFNKKIHIWKCISGEDGKTFSEYKNCIEYFIQKGVNRNSHLIAIGGGAISDLGGFVASTLLRGISWSVVPTTLLSMIDASIGGKVGINTDKYKNLIGSFHLPDTVLFYYPFLETLSEKEFRSGLGELVKYCFLDKEIYNTLMSSKDLNEVLYDCSNYKKKIVGKDFKENNKRKILNLGHTFGHAIEKIYQKSHGESVVWGMVVIFILFEKKCY